MKGKFKFNLIGLAGCVICAAWALVVQSGPALAAKAASLPLFVAIAGLSSY